MAITAAICNSYKQELLSGTHTSAHTYKMALYTSSATLSADTTVYASTNEVSDSGTNYTAGGVALEGFTTGLGSGTAWIDFTTNPSWANASFTARGALIYNSSVSNKAVAVIDFGQDVTATNGTFSVTFPAADASNALIRIT